MDDVAAAAAALRDAADATERLRTALRATAWWRAGALLGPDHGLSREQATTLMAMADRLVPAAYSRLPDAERFFRLASEIGLAKRASDVLNRDRVRAQLFAFLRLAIQIWPDAGARPAPAVPGAPAVADGPSLAELANLSELADLVHARTGRPDVTLDDLRNEYREVHGLDANHPVSLSDLRRLIGQVGLIKTVEPGLVNHASLLRLAKSERQVQQARDYLAAVVNLTERERRDLIWNLLNGLATDDALGAVLDLLNGSSPDELGRLFGERGRLGGRRLAERLLSAIPARRRELRERLTDFFRVRFGVLRPGRMTTGTLLSNKDPERRPILAPVPLADRPFSPKLLDPSLPADAGYLTPEQFEVAVRAADARGWRRPGMGFPNHEAVIRSLGLPADEQDRARDWLEELAGAAERDEDIRGHFSGDPWLGLDLRDPRLGLAQPGEERVIWQALRGIAPSQALDLLDDITDPNLKVLVAKGLRDQLARVFPPGHRLHERAAGFLARRLPGGQVMEPTVPERPFGPLLIAPEELGDISVRDPLTRDVLTRVGPVIGSRTRAEIARVLPRFERVQQARFDWWWNEVAEPARAVHRVQEYLNGSLTVIGNDDDLGPQLIGPLARHLDHTAWRVLDLVRGRSAKAAA